MDEILPYEKLKLRTRKYHDGVVLTNDYGNWVFLSGKEYEKFLFRDLDKVTFKKLEDNFMILTERNKKDIPHRINDYYWYINNGASLHIIVPTLRCNFTCKYCYAYRETENAMSKDMTEEIMDDTIDFIFTSPANHNIIEFTGGEPLLKFELIKRGIERAKKKALMLDKKVDFSVVTNGSQLNQEMVEYFLENKVGICLSLDGPKKIHDANRKITKTGEGSYDSVIDAINLLKKNEYPSINAMPVIVKDSFEYWKEIVDEYVKLKFNVVRFKFVSRFGFASDTWNISSYTAEEFLDKWKKVIDYCIELNKKGITIIENLAVIMIHKLAKGINSGYAELEIPCGAGIGQLAYNYDGAIYTCDEARTIPEFKIGDVKESKYIDVIDNPITKSLENISNLTAFNCDDHCPWFSFCGICPLEVYNEEKGLVTNIPNSYRHKIHLGMFEFLMDKIVHNEEEKEILYKWVDVTHGTIDTLPETSNSDIFKKNGIQKS